MQRSSAKIRIKGLATAALLWASAAASWAQALPAPAGLQPSEISSAAYPGLVTLQVDATDLDRKVLRVRQTLPVRPGPLSLAYARWIPGHHAPTADVTRLAGLRFSAGGQVLDWSRHPLDTHRFELVVPAGAETLDIELQHLSPPTSASGRVVVTRSLLNLQWQSLLLYPARFAADKVRVQAQLRLPEGWTDATALAAESRQDGVVRYRAVSLETLVDSPVFAGRHVQRHELDAPGQARPVTLNVFADRPEPLAASPAQIEAHRELVRQSDKLFGSRPFPRYDFLLALTDELGGIGLEHHASSENAVKPGYFKDWDKRVGSRELLPHEYVHAWNGKYRRPAELLTPNFNVPMQTGLLWLYEGQTEFWGWVLAARSGLTTAAQARERLARMSASVEARSGRRWRNLQDTTQDAIMSVGGRFSRDWWEWQRTRGDYYTESLLIWLEVDMLLRQKSGGTRSMDDFARAFFHGPDGDMGPRPYRFDDVVATLGGIVAHDWAGFLRARLDGRDQAPLGGVAASGWRLAWSDTPSAEFKADEAEARETRLHASIGLTLAQDARISAVTWEGPAYAAGIAPGATLVAVNLRAYKPEVLKDAITDARSSGAPIELLLREGDLFRNVRIAYRGGLRYPVLERLPDAEDRLAALLARR